MEDRQYPLYISVFLKIVMFGSLLLLTAVGIGLVLLPRYLPMMEAFQPFVIGSMWLVVMVLPWYWVLSIPYRITVAEGAITFRSLVLQNTLTPQDIISIQPDASQIGHLIVKHGKGKIRLVNQFDGFHTFLAQLRQANPDIILRGC